MSEYCYSPISLKDSVTRLFMLEPSKNGLDPLRGRLFEYRIEESSQNSHPYEALSYVWGHEDRRHAILIDDKTLHITSNLHTALRHIRDPQIPRTLWVDAICINQTNAKENKEKQHQINFMAAIYAKASRVLVWLGEARHDSDRALEVIRDASENGKLKERLNVQPVKQAIRQLIERPWFRRIWVLQEMAAARHILIKCGLKEVDGSAFCQGLKYLDTFHDESQCLISYLMQGAPFRSRHISRKQQMISLNICPLGELIDIFHAHSSSNRHDKVYALLGMSSDPHIPVTLKPDYNMEWKVLMQNLVQFLLGNHVSMEKISIDCCNDGEFAVITGIGCVLGKITLGRKRDFLGENKMEATFKAATGWGQRQAVASCDIRNLAKPVQDGDLICLLQGTANPMIVRLCGDHFTVIAIAPNLPSHVRIMGVSLGWSEFAEAYPYTREFLLVWDWSKGSKNRRHYRPFLRTSFSGLGNQLDAATRIWNVALILDDLGEHELAKPKFESAMRTYTLNSKMKCVKSPASPHSLTPLAWAAANGCEKILNLLIKHDIYLNLKDRIHGRTPLWWAAGYGHEDIVKMLVATDGIDIDLVRKRNNTTLLSWAAQTGQEAIVKILLVTGKADVDSKDNKYHATPLSWAAENGCEGIVKVLLETGKVDVNAKDSEYDATPLLWAAQNGHETIVKMLLATGNVDVNAKDSQYGMSSLIRAIQYGHEAIVKMLLETDTVDVNAKDAKHDKTPLVWAIWSRRENVVKLLLAAGDIDVNAKDNQYGMSTLIWAIRSKWETAVKLLLAVGNVDVNAKDSQYGMSPISWALRYGQEAIVKMLHETGKVE